MSDPVNEILEKFAEFSAREKELSEKGDAAFKEYNDYCASSDSDLSKKLSEIREKISKVEWLIQYARDHAQPDGLQEAQMPFETSEGSLESIRQTIRLESHDDPNAETLYTKATGQKLFYESKIEETKHLIEGSKVQAKRQYDSDLAEINRLKQEHEEYVKQYVQSEDFKEYVNYLTKDKAAFNSTGIADISGQTSVTIGQRRIKLSVPMYAEQDLSLISNGEYNAAARTIGAPFTVSMQQGSVLFLNFDERNGTYLLGGVARLLLNITKYFGQNIEDMMFVDPVHFSGDGLGIVSALTKGINPFIQVPSTTENVRARLSEIIEKPASENVSKVVVLHCFPEAYDSETARLGADLCAKAAENGILVILTHDSTKEETEIEKEVRSGAEVIRSRSGSFWIESKHETLFWYSAPSEIPDEVRRIYVEQRRQAAHQAQQAAQAAQVAAAAHAIESRMPVPEPVTEPEPVPEPVTEPEPVFEPVTEPEPVSELTEEPAPEPVDIEPAHITQDNTLESDYDIHPVSSFSGSMYGEETDGYNNFDIPLDLNIDMGNDLSDAEEAVDNSAPFAGHNMDGDDEPVRPEKQELPTGKIPKIVLGFGSAGSRVYLDVNSSSYICCENPTDRAAISDRVIGAVVGSTHPDKAELWIMDCGGDLISDIPSECPHLKYAVADKAADTALDFVDTLCGEVCRREAALAEIGAESFEAIPENEYMPRICAVVNNFTHLRRCVQNAPKYFGTGYTDKLAYILENGARCGVSLIMLGKGFSEDGKIPSCFGNAVLGSAAVFGSADKSADLLFGLVKANVRKPVSRSGEGYAWVLNSGDRDCALVKVSRSGETVTAGKYEPVTEYSGKADEYVDKRPVISDRRLRAKFGFEGAVENIAVLRVGKACRFAGGYDLCLHRDFGENVLAVIPSKEKDGGAAVIKAALKSLEAQGIAVEILGASFNPVFNELRDWFGQNGVRTYEGTEALSRVKELSALISGGECPESVEIILGGEMLLAEMQTADKAAEFKKALLKGSGMGCHFMFVMNSAGGLSGGFISLFRHRIVFPCALTEAEKLVRDTECGIPMGGFRLSDDCEEVSMMPFDI